MWIKLFSTTGLLCRFDFFQDTVHFDHDHVNPDNNLDYNLNTTNVPFLLADLNNNSLKKY